MGALAHQNTRFEQLVRKRTLQDEALVGWVERSDTHHCA